MIVLRPLAMQWLHDSPTDQCAHGEVEFTIDSVAFIAAESSPNVTVSAAGLFLLRTLSHDHRPGRSVTDGSQLFPCCGFSAFETSGPFEVIVFGCAVGVDLDVIHAPGTVTIRTK